MATVFRETERKYDAAGGAAAALEAARSMTDVAGVATVSQQDEQTLDAIYYDTEDLRLIRNGITLRQRTGGEDAGWHLKLPAGADTRDEIRLPLGKPAGRSAGKPSGESAGRSAGTSGGAVPEELAALVRARTRDAALVPVVHMRTTRGVLWLLGDAGRRLAEIATDHVSAELMDEFPATAWDEIEVELAAGDRELLKAVDARLRAAGARPAPTATKLERALGDRLQAARQAAGDGASAVADDESSRLTRRSRPATWCSRTCGGRRTPSATTTRSCGAMSRTPFTRCASRPAGPGARCRRSVRSSSGAGPGSSATS